MFLSRECGWLIHTQNKTTKNGCHPGPYFTHLFGLELYLSPFFSSLTKQQTFWDATTGFPTKWCLRNEHKMSILMTHHYPDQGSASHWLKIYFIHSEAVPRSAGLSLRAEGWGFAAATFLGNKGKMRPKELSQAVQFCTYSVLTAYARKVEILVTAVQIWVHAHVLTHHFEGKPLLALWNASCI